MHSFIPSIHTSFFRLLASSARWLHAPLTLSRGMAIAASIDCLLQTASVNRIGAIRSPKLYLLLRHFWRIFRNGGPWKWGSLEVGIRRELIRTKCGLLHEAHSLELYLWNSRCMVALV